MPTGYTSHILDGCSFEDFAKICARNFGAMVNFKDEEPLAELPERIPYDSFYKEAIEETQRELIRLSLLSKEERVEEVQKATEELKEQEDREARERAEKRQKYEDMLSRVKTWEPPSERHIKLKQFMMEQIVESMDFDCREPYPWKACPVEDPFWFENRIEKLTDKLFDLKELDLKEEQRVVKANQWLDLLRKSL